MATITHTIEFPGFDMEARDMDLALMRSFPNDFDAICERERKLAKACWWEYRGMHPVKRTRLFGKLCNKVYVESQEKYTGIYRAPIAVSKLFTSLIKEQQMKDAFGARQAADALGMPYDTFVRLGINEAVDRGWSRLPNVRQLYGKARPGVLPLIGFIAMRWKEELPIRALHFTAPTLMADSTAPWKGAFDEWLCKMIRAKGSSMVAMRLIDQGVLSQATAEKLLPAELIE